MTKEKRCTDRHGTDGCAHLISMKFSRAIFTSLLTLCLVLCLLTGGIAPVAAAETLDMNEMFTKLRDSLGISSDVYANYDAKYAQSLPLEYEKTSSSAYLALGGDTASGFGSSGYTDGNYDNSYANKFAISLGLFDTYENHAKAGLEAADAVDYINGVGDRRQYVPKAIKLADFITFQLDSSALITSCINSMTDNMGAELNWSKYISDPQFTTHVANFRQQVINEYTAGYGDDAESIAMVLEYMLYECVAYGFETVNAVNAIHALNPNATVLVLGLYNPFRGLTFTADGQTIAIGEMIEEMVDFCNIFLLDKTLNMDKTAFLDISAATTPGFGNIVLDTESSASLQANLMEIRKDINKQHANQAGHDYIYQQLTTSHRLPCKHPTNTVVNQAGATCQSEGYTGDTVCSSCGKLLKTGTTIAKTGHKYGAWTQTKPASCIAEGEQTHACTVCSYTETRTINKSAHRLDGGTVTKEPDCIAAGTKAYRCTNPECTYVWAETLPALGHEYGAGVTTKAPDCVNNGTVTYTCTRNGCHHTTTESILALGHLYDEGTVTVQPGCTTEGTRTFACTRTGCHEQQTESIAAIGHKLDNGTITKQPECEAEGIKTFACTNTGCTHTVTESIPATGHNIGEGVVTKEPGCVTQGVKSFPCTNAGCDHAKTEVLPPIGHEFDDGKITKQPDCVTAGVKTFTCIHSDCTHTKTESIPTVDHKFDSGKITTQPTCSTQGIRTFTCTVCGGLYTELVPTTDHKYDNGTVTTEPSCGKNGVKTFSCITCDLSYTESIPAADHKWDEGVISRENGCEAEGKKTFTCTSCGDTKDEPTPAIAHKWNEGAITKDPGCEAEGERTFSCINDGCTHTKTEAVAAVGHTFGEYTSNGDATCRQDGTKTANCNNCDAKDTVWDPASHIDHIYENNVCIFCQAEQPSGSSGTVWWVVGTFLITTVLAGFAGLYLGYYKKIKLW